MIRKAEPKDTYYIWQVHSHYTQQQIQAWISCLHPEIYSEVIETREFFVAEDSNKFIVGFGQLNSDTGEIEAVYVSPQSVRCGWGKKFYKQLRILPERKG